MPQALFPDARFRSPTAVEGKADIRDENVYSAALLQHGGAGQQKIFTVPFGQSIVNLAGSSINSPPTGAGTAHQSKYTELTTNLTKAGELGSAIGDASIRALGCTLEQAAYTASSGAQRLFGATSFEVADILSRVFLELKIGGKRQIIGAVHMFPSSGGAYGSVSTTGSGATVGVVSNGWPGSLRRLKYPILVGRTDALDVTVGVAGSSTLAFSTTTGDGQPTLLWN